jgi:dGTPase
MVTDIIYSSQEKLPQLGMSPEVLQATEKLRSFLNERVYYNEQTYGEFRKAYKIVEELYRYFLEDPKRMPTEFRRADEADKVRMVCDFIAGMTDRYALKTYEDIFLPQPWLVM